MMYSVLQRVTRKPPRLVSLAPITHSRSFTPSTSLNSLSDRLQRRRTQSDTSNTAQDSPSNETVYHTASQSKSNASQGNLTTDLGSLTERAISADPAKEEEARKQRQREQARANRIKWENKDRAKQIIEIKKGQSQRTGENGGKEVADVIEEKSEEKGKGKGKEQDSLSNDVRRRMGFSNPGRDKRDLKKALRLARLASGRELTTGEQEKLESLKTELEELKRKRRRMVPWDQLSKKLKKMETYKVERRIKRDEDREMVKNEKATANLDSTTSSASAQSPSSSSPPEPAPPLSGSFDESLASAQPTASTSSLPIVNHDNISPYSSPTAPSPTIPSEPPLSKGQHEKLMKQLHADAARRAWSLRRNTIDQEIKDLETAISAYLPPTAPISGPPIPQPKKRTSPPLLSQFVDKLQVSESSSSKGKEMDSSAEEAARMLMGAVRESNRSEEQAEKARERRGRISPKMERDERSKLEREAREERLKTARSRPYKDHPALQPSTEPTATPPPRELSSYPHHLSPSSVPFSPTPSPLGPVPIATLSHSLSRALFNPGVHFLRDPRSGVYNFSPEILENVPKLGQFEFGKLPQYVTSSKDETLREVASREGKRFSGSTSSTVGMLCQIYFWLSKGKQVNTSMLSSPWSEMDRSFSMGQQLPVSVVLNHEGEGNYSIDADKSFDATSDSNVLADYGHLMEKLLTTDPKDFKRFLIGSEDPAPSEADHRQAYHYAVTDNMVLRSQLDAVHEHLPGNGTFDLKTRGTVAIRQDRLNYEESAGYTIDRLRGPWESFEREYYDLIRSAFLKYQFQARIGCMDGIFVAYHSTARFYGFQYLPISEMDEALFGSTETGQQVFRLAVGMLERLLKEASECFPGESVNVTWAADPKKDVLRLFVTPLERDAKEKEATEDVYEEEEPQVSKPPMTLLEVRGTNYLDGEICEEAPVIRPSSDDPEGGVPVWQIGYEITKSTGENYDSSLPPSPSSPLHERQISDLFNQVRENQKMFSSLMLPTGVTTKEIKLAAERAKQSGVELDPSDLSVRFPLDQGVTYRGPSNTARDLRKMSREGLERMKQDEKDREGEKIVVVNSTLEIREQK